MKTILLAAVTAISLPASALAGSAVLDRIAGKPRYYRAGYVAGFITTADSACATVVGETELPHIKSAGRMYWRIYERHAARDGFKDGVVDAGVDRRIASKDLPAWCGQVVELTKEGTDF